MFGILNVGLALNVSVCCSIISTAFIDGCFLEGSATAGLMYTVSPGANPLRLCRARYHHFLRLQTVAHSILSTRIVLHTGRALRKGSVCPRPPFVLLRIPSKKGSAVVSEGQRGVNGHGHRMMDSADAELQQLINNDI